MRKNLFAALSLTGLLWIKCALATTLTIIFFMPLPNHTYLVPSGNQYKTNIYGITPNVSAGDVNALQQMGGMQLNARNNVSAVRAPLTTDDFTAGFGVGSQWVYLASGAPTIYVLTAMTSTAGSATWTQVSAIGATGTVNAALAGQLGYYATSSNVIGGNANANIANGALTLGQANSVLGSLILEGSTSGAATIVPPAVAGTPTLTLPITTGTLISSGNLAASLTYLGGNLGCTTGTLTQLGCLSPDGTTITVSGGVISAPGSGGGGSGIVGSGIANQLAYYPATGTTVGGQSMTAALDNFFGTGVGQILCRGTVQWQALAAGTTGNFLKTNGTSGCPSCSTGGAVSTVSNSDGTLTISPTSGAVVASLNLANTNAWTGNQYFQSGYPWCDVRAEGALGNGSHDDTSAINACLTISAANNGGIVFFPPGQYKITSQLNVSNYTFLVGAGASSTSITTAGADLTAIEFLAAPAGGGHNGLRDISVYTNQTSSAGTYAVIVDSNEPTFMRDCTIWGGYFALNTGGVDGYVENCFIQGFGTSGGNMRSAGGANWYQRVKFDDNGQSHQYGVLIDNAGSGALENHFVMCDFSGSFTYSLYINYGQAITVAEGSAFNQFITEASYELSSFVGDEMVHISSANLGNTSISGSLGIGSVSATGAKCAANVSISC